MGNIRFKIVSICNYSLLILKMFSFTKNKTIVSTYDYIKLTQEIETIEERYINTFRGFQVLKKKLSAAKKVEPRDIPANVVTMNSKIRLDVLDTRNTMLLDLVYPGHADVSRFKVSIFSSLGIAIFSGRIGDEITYSTGIKSYRVRIMGIPFQPEANGIYNL